MYIKFTFKEILAVLKYATLMPSIYSLCGSTLIIHFTQIRYGINYINSSFYLAVITAIVNLINPKIVHCLLPPKNKGYHIKGIMEMKPKNPCAQRYSKPLMLILQTIFPYASSLISLYI